MAKDMQTAHKTPDDPVADAAMDAKMREIWARFEKPWIRQALRKMLPPTPVNTLGCQFIVHPADNYTEARMWEFGYPPEHVATQYLADLLAGSGPVIVDVGANAGAFFLPIHVAGGPKSRSYVFEPNPAMLARLKVNIKANKRTRQVKVFDFAVGDAEGRSPLYYPRNGNLGQGRIVLAYPHARASEGPEVSIRPLADCLLEAKLTRIDLLKVDVEGLEDRVIVPLLNSDAKLLPRLIYFEVAHDGLWQCPLMETLKEKGYALLKDFGENSLFERRVSHDAPDSSADIG